MKFIIGHFLLVHVLQGSLFGLMGILGAISPDVLGLVGWWQRWRQDGKIVPAGFYRQLPAWARHWYYVMHSVQFWIVVVFVELFVRYSWCFIDFGIHGLNAPMVSLYPMFSFGYFTHILLDWVTHRQDLGAPVMLQSGVVFGIDWYRSRYYWTEIAGAALVLVVVFITQDKDNMLLGWML